MIEGFVSELGCTVRECIGNAAAQERPIVWTDATDAATAEKGRINDR